MSEEVTSLMDVATFTVAFLAYLEARKGNKTPEAISALQKVIEASEKTETYLVMRTKGETRNIVTEQNLAEIWSEASFLISRVNQELSRRLSAKSEFWRDPDAWDEAIRAHKDISLISVTDDAKKLLASYA